MSTYRLRVYEADDTTLLAEFSTDPAHARPHLHAPANFAEQAIDLARGAATIGQVNAAVIDVPTVPGDQTTGYFTSILATSGGHSALIGRRALMEQDRGGGFATLMDGVIGDVRLASSYAGYEMTLRDIRERERKTRAFVTVARWGAPTVDENGIETAPAALIDAPTIWPRGRILPYGPLSGGGFLVPATTPMVGTYVVTTSEGLPIGQPGISFPTVNENAVPVHRIFTQRMAGAIKVDPATRTILTARLHWRAVGTSTWYTAPPLEPVQYVYQERAPLVNTRPGKFRPASGAAFEVDYISSLTWNWTTIAYVPPFAPGTQVEVLLAYAGEPTKDYPFRWEGPSGQLLAELYDGEHSEMPSRIRYDAPAVAAFQTPFSLVRDKPAEDLRDWAEKHWYAIQGAAPALNPDGEIAPVRYALPAADAVLPELNNSNCVPLPGWEHTAGDAINSVTVEYAREFAVPAADDPTQARSTGEGVASRTVIVERWDMPSIELLGEQRLELKPETVRAYSLMGGAAGGDVANEVGHQLAEQRARQALDRFVLGGQHLRSGTATPPCVRCRIPWRLAPCRGGSF